MGIIPKSYAITAAVLSTLGLFCGVGISITSFIINSKLPGSITVTDGGIDDHQSPFRLFWTCGFWFVVTGMLGIAVGATRRSCVMIAFLIFNILSLLAAIGIVIMLVLLLIFWGGVNEHLSNDLAACLTINGNCACGDITEGKAWIMKGVSCSDLEGIQVLLMVMVGLGGLCSLFYFITSYVSCCSLCDQERVPTTYIVQSQPIATNTVFVGQTANVAGYAPHPHAFPQNNAMMPPPYPYSQQGGYKTNEEIDMQDTAKLIDNEIQ